MTVSTQAWIVSPTASLLHLSGSWLLDDPHLGGARELSFSSQTVWDLLRRLVELGPTDPDSAAAAAIAVGIPEAIAGRCVESLQRAGILVPESSRPAIPRDAPVLQDWRLANIAIATGDRDPSTLSSEPDQMEVFGSLETPPVVSRQWSAAVRRKGLPHPIHDSPDRPHYALGSVLYYSHAILKPTALGPLPRSLRVPPSYGEVHPFDLTVTLLSQREQGPITFGYDPMDHALVRLPTSSFPSEVLVNNAAGKSPGRSDPALIAVHLAARRVQWRYRTCTAYPTIFLDLGHLLGVMHAAAEAHGLALTEIAVPEQDPIGKDAEAFGPVLSLRLLRTSPEECGSTPRSWDGGSDP
jgi:hypothetical protein